MLSLINEKDCEYTDNEIHYAKWLSKAKIISV